MIYLDLLYFYSLLRKQYVKCGPPADRLDCSISTKMASKPCGGTIANKPTQCVHSQLSHRLYTVHWHSDSNMYSCQYNHCVLNIATRAHGFTLLWHLNATQAWRQTHLAVFNSVMTIIKTNINVTIAVYCVNHQCDSWMVDGNLHRRRRLTMFK